MMDPDADADTNGESELQSLLSVFKAHKSPGKLTDTKKRQQTPRSARSSASVAAYSPAPSFTPLPSPLSVYTPSASQTNTTQLSDTSAASIGQPVQLSKEQQAEAIVLSLIQDRATGVDWNHEPHVSNLRSLFHLEHDEAVQMLGTWYPCIGDKRLSRAIEQYRYKVQKEEDKESDVEIIQVHSKVGTSFDSAIVLDSDEEMGEACLKAGNSFDSAIVINDEEDNGGKVQDVAAKTRYGESSLVDMSMLLISYSYSVETAGVLLPAHCPTPSPDLAPITIAAPNTPNISKDISQLPTPATTSRPLVQHSREYSPPDTPTRRPDYSLELTGSPHGKRKYDVLEKDIGIEVRASKSARKELHSPSSLKGPASKLQAFSEEQPFQVLEKAQQSYPSPTKTPPTNPPSSRGLDRSSPTRQRRSGEATSTGTRRARLLKVDSRIEIPNVVLKAQREDTSDILAPKGSTRLPRDRMLLALLSEHKDRRRFVANVFGCERKRLMAPELRGVLSMDVVRRSGEIKRGLECSASEDREIGQVTFVRARD